MPTPPSTYLALGRQFPRRIKEKVIDANSLIAAFTSAERKIVESVGTRQK